MAPSRGQAPGQTWPPSPHLCICVTCEQECSPHVCPPPLGHPAFKAPLPLLALPPTAGQVPQGAVHDAGCNLCCACLLARSQFPPRPPHTTWSDQFCAVLLACVRLLPQGPASVSLPEALWALEEPRSWREWGAGRGCGPPRYSSTSPSYTWAPEAGQGAHPSVSAQGTWKGPPQAPSHQGPVAPGAALARCRRGPVP